MSRYIPAWKKPFRLPIRFGVRMREHGLLGAMGWCWYQVAWRLRERRMGIDTREFAHGVVVDGDDVCHGYEPIDHLCLDIILDSLESPEEEVFLDYGCGMGRAVVLAATRSLRGVIGVEIDPDLCEIARRQVARAAERGYIRSPRVEIVTADASTWEVPPEVTCVFLFNSFVGDLLQAVLEQIRRSLARHPRPLKLVYVQPVADRDTLADCPWLRAESRLPTGYWTHVRTTVYVPQMEQVLAE